MRDREEVGFCGTGGRGPLSGHPNHESPTLLKTGSAPDREKGVKSSGPSEALTSQMEAPICRRPRHPRDPPLPPALRNITPLCFLCGSAHKAIERQTASPTLRQHAEAQSATRESDSNAVESPRPRPGGGKRAPRRPRSTSHTSRRPHPTSATSRRPSGENRSEGRAGRVFGEAGNPRAVSARGVLNMLRSSLNIA